MKGLTLRFYSGVRKSAHPWFRCLLRLIRASEPELYILKQICFLFEFVSVHKSLKKFHG